MSERLIYVINRLCVEIHSEVEYRLSTRKGVSEGLILESQGGELG